MAWAIDAMLADSQHQDHENSCRAVISGMVRVLVCLACPAGSGWLGRTGTACPPINLLLAGGGSQRGSVPPLAVPNKQL